MGLMLWWFMSDRPGCFNSITRTARKDHKCCECWRTIKAGEKYQYSSGVWDGEPDSFKQCLNCHDIMNLTSLVDEYDAPGFGELRRWFEGFVCRGLNGETWLREMAADIKFDPEKLNKLLRVLV